MAEILHQLNMVGYPSHPIIYRVSCNSRDPYFMADETIPFTSKKTPEKMSVGPQKLTYQHSMTGLSKESRKTTATHNTLVLSGKTQPCFEDLVVVFCFPFQKRLFTLGLKIGQTVGRKIHPLNSH